MIWWVFQIGGQATDPGLFVSSDTTLSGQRVSTAYLGMSSEETKL